MDALNHDVPDYEGDERFGFGKKNVKSSQIPFVLPCLGQNKKKDKPNNSKTRVKQKVVARNG